MKLQVQDNELHIILSAVEAATLVIDHGEDELIVPLPEDWDSVGLSIQIGDCLRELEP